MTSEREKPFTVVEFEDGICMVPATWLFNNNTLCYYPPYQSQIKINKAIALMCEPDRKTWQKYTIQKIFCSAENYERGMEKLKLAEAMSDVESSDTGQGRS